MLDLVQQNRVEPWGVQEEIKCKFLNMCAELFWPGSCYQDARLQQTPATGQKNMQ
jgi:hypothetical protein